MGLPGRQHPDRRPGAAPRRQLRPRLDAAVEEVALALRHQPRGGVPVRTTVLPVRGDGQHAVADGRIVDAVGIRLEFVVAPAVAAEVMAPFRRIRTAGVVELVLPGGRALECPGRSEENTSELQSLM